MYLINKAIKDRCFGHMLLIILLSVFTKIEEIQLLSKGLNSVNSVIGCELRADVVQYLAVS